MKRGRGKVEEQERRLRREENGSPAAQVHQPPVHMEPLSPKVSGGSTHGDSRAHTGTTLLSLPLGGCINTCASMVQTHMGHTYPHLPLQTNGCRQKHHAGSCSIPSTQLETHKRGMLWRWCMVRHRATCMYCLWACDTPMGVWLCTHLQCLILQLPLHRPRPHPRGVWERTMLTQGLTK